MPKKIVLIGRAGVGKTTLKNMVFEGANQNDLILYPLEPTRGINPFVYKWLDVELGVFDTSGQELPFLLGNIDAQKTAFQGCDALIYVIDFLHWTCNSKDIIEEIQKIETIVHNIEKDMRIYLFLHKIDLLNQKGKGNFEGLRMQFMELSPLFEKYDLFFTSIYPKLVFSVFYAISEILGSFSSLAGKLKEIIDSVIWNLPKTICFITNKENQAIIYCVTKDFDINLIPQIHKTISSINHSTEELYEIYNEFHFIDVGNTILSMVMENLGETSPELKNLFCLSETHYKDKLNNFKQEIKNEILKISDRGGI